MTFLDNITREFLEEAVPVEGDTSQTTSKTEAMLRDLLDLEHNPMYNCVIDIEPTIELFREGIQNSGDVHIRTFFDNIVKTQTPVNTSVSIFNNFKTLEKSYKKFFSSVDTIRLSRYV